MLVVGAAGLLTEVRLSSVALHPCNSALPCVTRGAEVSCSLKFSFCFSKRISKCLLLYRDLHLDMQIHGSNKGKRHLGFILAAETTEESNERGNKPKYKQTFVV